MFTFPLIGNYGVDPKNFQNPKVCALGCITKENLRETRCPAFHQVLFEENRLLA